MALKCRINNGVVEAPNGNVSKLFSALSNRFGQQKALELYALTETEEYNDALFLDVDSNGEMTINNFLKFSLRSENPVDFTQESIDLQHKIPANKINNLKRVFKFGIFTPTYDNLKSTEVFTEDEIYEIIYSQEKQQNLKTFVEELNVIENVDTVSGFVTSSGVYNDIGISPIKNPEVVKQEVLDIISQGKTRTEVESLISSIPYQDIIDRIESDPIFKEAIIQEAFESNPITIVRDENATVDLLMNTLDVSQLDEIERAAQRALLFDDKNLLLEEFDNLQDSLMDAGVDLNMSEYEVASKSVEEIKKFVQAIQDLTLNMNEDSVKVLADSMEEFKPTPLTKTVNTSNYITNSKASTLRYLDTKLDEITNFTENSLIKHSENVFQKVKDNYSLDQLYEALYIRITSNPGILPSNTLKSAIQDEVLSLEILRDPINKEFVIEDIENFVKSKLDTLPVADIETKEKIIIYKLNYGANIETIDNSEGIYEPSGDISYLQDSFISDFSKEQLRHKRRDSKEYNSFYKFLKIDHKGIRPIDGSTYTQDHIINNLKSISESTRQNLINYSKISKHFGLVLESSSYIDPIIEERLDAQQNVNLLPSVQNDYKIVGSDEIITTTENSQFVRMGETSYERVLEFSNIALYKALPKGDSIFKPTQLDKPVSDRSIEFLKDYVVTEDSKITHKKYLTKQELEEINKEFDCQ